MYSKWSNFVYLSKKIYHINHKCIPLHIIYGIFTALYFSVGIYFPKWLIAELQGKARVDMIFLIIAMMVVSVCVAKFMTMVFEVYNSDYNTSNIYAFKTELGNKRMSIAYQETQEPDQLDLQERASEATNCMPKLYNSIYIRLTSGILRALFSLGFFLRINVVCVFILLSSSIATYFINKKFWSVCYQLETSSTKENRGITYIQNTIQNLNDSKYIRLYKMTSYLIQKLCSYQECILNRCRQIERKRNMNSDVLMIIDCIQTVAVYLYIVIEYATDRIIIGDFIIALPMATLFINAIKDILDVFANYSYLNNYVNDFRNFVSGSTEDKQDSETEYLPIPRNDIDIKFENVCFRYSEKTPMVLENINIRIEGKHSIIMIGDNGSGKSTFIKLLLRLYEPTSGRITLNGFDVKRYRIEDYWKIFTVDFQDYKIFEYSIKDNICIGDNTRRQELLDILDAMNLKKRIQALDTGVDTVVSTQLDSNGKNFSGGELQRMSVCRAIYKNAEVGILDEPTASLDPIAEQEIFKNYLSKEKFKTAMFVSHRLSIARLCDQIIVLQNGSIVEIGGYGELLEKKGIFYTMHQIQSSLYNGDLIGKGIRDDYM